MPASLQAQPRRPPPAIPLERTKPDGPSAQVTAVGSAAAAPGVPRLVVTAGPRKGAEFALFEPLTRVGRSTGNAVAIADLSVSRRHSRVEKRSGRWVLFDEGSGNGTRVNGRPVGRRVLRHGDEIGLGDTRLRFLEPGGVFAWGDGAARTVPRRSHLYAAAAAAVAMVLAACIVRERRSRDAAEAQARSLALRERAQLAFRQGLSLAKQGKWAEARDRLQVAAELEPRDAAIAQALQSAQSEALRLEAALPPPAIEAALAATVPAAKGAAEEAIAASSASPPGREVRKALATRHPLPARRLSAASELAGRAAYLPGGLHDDSFARAGVADRARDLYLRAYLAKDDDPAAARMIFARVAAILPPDDETARKARRWLEKLQGEVER